MQHIFISTTQDNQTLISTEYDDGKTYSRFDSAIITYPNADRYIWHYDYHGINLQAVGKNGLEIYKKLTAQIRQQMNA